MNIISFILNIIIVILEVYTFIKIKDKKNIFKYYTYIQNFLALLTSTIFCIYFILSSCLDFVIPEFVKGLRYIATCGLVSTMIIYILIILLGSKEKNILSQNDFNNFNYKIANFILHFLCPILSFLSFVLFERDISLTNSIYTMLVMIPSSFYWTLYLFLTVTNLWEEPYDFSKQTSSKIGKYLRKLIMIIIPLSFVIVSYILWNIM